MLNPIDTVSATAPQNVPTVTQEPGGVVLGEGDSRIPFDGNVVVVIDPAEIVKAKVARQRRRLRSDALHHATIPTNGIDVVIEDVEAGLVVAAGKPLLADRHTYAGSNALPEWTAGGLDARDPVILWMPRRLTVELPETAYVVERNRGLAQALVIGVHRFGAGQLKHVPEQHRGVTARDHEAAPGGPGAVLRR